MLSVIVPVYNAEKYLEQCVGSILNQSLKEIELILVDDGSTDASGALCDRHVHIDKRVRVIHLEHGGPILARKTGVDVSEGEYITFVDADDYINKQAYIYAEEAMGAGREVICFDMGRLLPDGQTKYERCRLEEKTYSREEIMQEIVPKMLWEKGENRYGLDPSLANKIIKRELVKKIYEGLQESDFHYGEDIAVTYPAVYEAKSLEVIHKNYYNHRIRANTEVAPYIKAEDYFDKLYVLYRYLKKKFQDNRDLIDQIELFYIHSIDYKKRVYHVADVTGNYLFPFERVRKDAKIVLYGAGNVGQNYVSQIKKTNFCEIEAWVDKEYAKYEAYGVVSIDYIFKAQYDFIVIAIADLNIRRSVAKMLCDEGVEKNRIVMGEGTAEELEKI